MEITSFWCEEWLNVHEQSAGLWPGLSLYPVHGSDNCLRPTQTDGSAFFQKFQKTTLNYGWIEGSPAFKGGGGWPMSGKVPDNILQTNGATGGNCWPS